MDTSPSNEPLVTIAIPTYNRARQFLPQALRAACTQTYRNLEILVADNASGDDTAQVVAGFQDDRIRYHRHPANIGVSGNFNFCIQQARGKYIHLLMDDDSIDPDFIDCCVQAFASNPQAGIARTGTRVVDGNGNLVYESRNLVQGLGFPEFVVAWTEGKTAPFLCSTLFRAEPLKASGMHSRHYLWCDVLTELPIAAKFGRVDIPDIKASFCMHAGELTVGVDIGKWLDDSMQLLDTVCALVPDDAAMIKSRLRPFLATFNYRNALRLKKPWLARFRACLSVRRTFGNPPRTGDLVREILRQSRWWNASRKSRRSIKQYLRA